MCVLLAADNPSSRNGLMHALSGDRVDAVSVTDCSHADTRLTTVEAFIDRLRRKLAGADVERRTARGSRRLSPTTGEAAS